MPADIAYLRKHYESLSDEALLDLDRAELTEEAQQCYDDELKERRLGTAERGYSEVILDGEKPDWADEAACVCTFPVTPPNNSPGALDARTALDAAGIDCYLATRKMDDSDVPRDEVWVMVPGQVSMVARSVLDQQIFNKDAEAEWKTYFEALSDDELREADTEQLFCGVLDRLERMTRVYEEEKARRGV